MKRTQNRKETVRRERMIMILSSVFVLAALVCVGFYMRGQTTEEQGDGYEIDFAELESNVSGKYEELAEGVQGQNNLANADDALDYMPREDILEEGIYMQEADSGNVEIGKLQKDIKELTKGIESIESPISEDIGAEEMLSEEERLALEAERLLGEPAFTEVNGLYLPVEGEVLMHYDMDHTVYFATLDQYKYNPATIISAAVGAPVYACADATVSSIYSNEEIGTAIVLNLGNGYEVTYGQVKDLQCQEGDKVARGKQIAAVAAPTIYYTVEGSNLYFAMKKDGETRSAEALLPIQ